MDPVSNCQGHFSTNKIVSKFIQGVNANCTFCENYIENILHLFWECEKVSTFLVSIHDNFVDYFICLT